MMHKVGLVAGSVSSSNLELIRGHKEARSRMLFLLEKTRPFGKISYVSSLR